MARANNTRTHLFGLSNGWRVRVERENDRERATAAKIRVTLIFTRAAPASGNSRFREVYTERRADFLRNTTGISTLILFQDVW